MSAGKTWVWLSEGKLEVIDAETTPAAELAALQRRVGGYVELFRCGLGIDAYCDEVPKALPASCVVKHRGGWETLLRGPVVFVVPRATSPEDSIARVLRIAQLLTPFPSTESGPPDPTSR